MGTEQQDWNKKVIDEFRANDGRVGGSFANMSLLLVHTVGAKTGLPRLTPLVYMTDQNRLIIIASNGGAANHPDWYYNILAEPQVEVEVGTEQFSAYAEVAQEPERSRLYNKMAASYPFFADYQRQASREIPVILLTRHS